MKARIHIRFAAYVLWVTSIFAALILSWHSEFPWMIVFILWMPSGLKLIGNSSGRFFESTREVSDRALVWGFIGVLVISWAGVLYVGYPHFSHMAPNAFDLDSYGVDVAGFHLSRLLLVESTNMTV